MRPPELVAAMRRLRQQLLPRPVPPLPHAEVQQQEQRHRAKLVCQLLAPFAPPGQPAPASAALQPAAAAWVQVGAGAIQAAPQQPAPAAQQAARGGAPTAAGQPPAKPAKHAKRGGGADMQYFLQLQRGGGGTDGGAVGSPPGGAASSSSSGEASAEEAVAAHLERASTAVHSVELPAAHAQLLRLLREDEQRLVAAAPAQGVPAEVARSDFLSVDALQRALRAAAGGRLS